MSSYNYSYNVLINRLEAFAAGHFMIRRFTHGQIDLADQLQDDQYPFMHVVPEQIRPVDGGMQFDFLIMFADIPRDKEYKAEYQREVISDCVRLGQDLVAEVKNGLQLFGFDVQLTNNPTFEPFMEEQKNTVTGVTFTLSLEVPWDWSACDIPAIWTTQGASSGGTANPYGITLRTNGVNNQVQNILDLVAGSNITITDNGDGSVTFDAQGDSIAHYVSTEWNANHTTATGNPYVIGDRVWYNGSVYQCIANNDAINPSNPSYWTLLSVGYRLRQNPVDWNATSGDYQILNKPTIPAAQVNSDWNANSGVAEILNKPTIPAAQVNSDWNSVSGLSQILNKPSLATVATSGNYNDLSNLPTIPAAQIQSDWNQSNVSALDFIKNKPTIPAAQVNSDWNAISGLAQILNKPIIPAAQVNSDWNAVSGLAQILNKPTIPAAQIQSDWNQTNVSALDYIKNKPSIGSGTVTSVALAVPSAFSVSGSPVTTSGTLAITATGTSAQYIDGTGALQTMPTASAGLKHGTASGTDTYTVTLSGVTSYTDGDAYLIRFTNGNTTGCTLNINSIGAVSLYRNNDGLLIGGDIWDGAEMLCIYNSTTGGFQCIGTSPNSLFAYVTNAETSATITKGQPVYAFGGTGDRLKVKLAYNTSDATSAQTVGMVVSTSIAPNQKGIIIVAGQLDNLSTLPTSTFADGDPIYLGSTAGTITKTKPSAPNHLVYLGFVTSASNGNAGRMYVRVQNGYEMDELHDVQSSGAANNDILYRDTTANLWKPASIPTILGYTPVTNARTISTTSPLSGGGDLTANRTLSIADAAADGSTKGAAAFTASDFNSASGVISIDYANAQKATAAQPGFLTAADWTTFNTKPSKDTLIFTANPNATQGAASTGYWAITGSLSSSATENFRNVLMPVAGTLKNLYVRNGTTQSGTGSIVFTVRKNGADTTMTVTFTNADGASATKSDTTNTVSVVAGDLICIKGVNNAPASASGNIVSFSIILERS